MKRNGSMKPAGMIAALAAVIGLLAGATQAQGAGLSGGALGAVDVQYMLDLWKKGGTTMWFLLFLSVMGVAFCVERLVRLRRDRVVPRGFGARVNQMWQQGNLRELRALCDRDKSVMAEIVDYIVRHRKRHISDVSAGTAEIAVRELRPHFRRAYPLLVVATLAPLFGLFGTVVGMMEAFENFRLLGEHGDPSIFAGAISKALVTTIVGLGIAMPTLAAYHFFKTRTNRLGDILETEVSDLIDDWLMQPDLEEPAAVSKEGDAHVDQA
jgi:biopolymer transport protein ExbB